MVNVTASITTVGLDSIDGVLTRVELVPNAPFLDGGVGRVGRCRATIDGEQLEMDLAPTPPGFFYRLEATWIDADGYEHVETIDTPIRVPTTGGDLGDFPEVPFSSERCWTGAAPPADRQLYPWWLKTDVTGPTDPDAAYVGWLLHWKG